MRLRRRNLPLLGYLILTLAVAAGFYFGTPGSARKIRTEEHERQQSCEANDHFAQIQSWQIRHSTVLLKAQKEVRLRIIENYRDELGCRDVLPPNIIRDALEGKKGP